MRRRTVVGLTASTLMGVVFLVAMMPVATLPWANCSTEWIEVGV